MSCEGEEHPDAKYRERMLTAFDDRLEDLPVRPAPVLRYDACHQEREDDEMQHAIRGEVYPAVGIESFNQPCREHPSELRETSRHGHCESETEIGNSDTMQNGKIEGRADSSRAA